MLSIWKGEKTWSTDNLPFISHQLLCSHVTIRNSFCTYTESFTTHINKIIQTVYLILSGQELNTSVQTLTDQTKRYNQVETDAAEPLVLLSICYLPLHAGNHRKLLCLRRVSAAQHAAAPSPYTPQLEQKSIQYHFRRAVLTCPGKYQSVNPAEASPAPWRYDRLLGDLLTWSCIVQYRIHPAAAPEVNSTFMFVDEKKRYYIAFPTAQSIPKTHTDFRFAPRNAQMCQLLCCVLHST